MKSVSVSALYVRTLQTLIARLAVRIFICINCVVSLFVPNSTTKNRPKEYAQIAIVAALVVSGLDHWIVQVALPALICFWGRAEKRNVYSNVLRDTHRILINNAIFATMPVPNVLI